ncbi:MAG: bifunctional diaminohydroxyphosphoribosylaminopyrimidine deaminase/5-amino-6-(5-phosphoribosylamino)uracil reductase RibD [Ottowia sp.]|uniref:bifunctional diaminohydroxyphosphoribosylaminopyrimidine deaminase/5-amino-6-(5-phosphoribosylamino)uracil reductase RibD n=1 Tax=Ottowia sp. TaxID=1898956 RepID=UPI0039E5EB75
MTADALDPPMRLALDLAARARVACPPNPAVGCVIVGTDGAVRGQGHTQPVGQAHAEVMALRDAAARGHPVAGATAYVTLEPCAHHGRTGPCCDALAAAGIGRVVASLQDPNPRVAGQGFARLRAVGIDVQVGPGAEESRELNIGFFSRMVRGLPWVRLKAAGSLDGRTALPNGRSQWITSPEARADGHAWRARACVVLTGIGTVLQDDPQLDVRLAAAPRQPDLVVVDSRLETPMNARLWHVDRRRVRIYTAAQDTARQQALADRGAEVIVLPDARGKVDLAAMLRDLARREVNEVHVEAGFKLNGSLMRAGLVDELLLYQAPLLLGEGQGIAAIGPFETLAEGTRFEWRDVHRVGPDLRVLARGLGRGGF